MLSHSVNYYLANMVVKLVNMVSSMVVVLVVLSSFEWTRVGGFNLEPRIPVIKNGMAGSYFGYSVAQHQSISVETGSVLNNWSV